DLSVALDEGGQSSRGARALPGLALWLRDGYRMRRSAPEDWLMYAAAGARLSRYGLCDQNRNSRSEGEGAFVRRAEDNVWRQANRQRRYGLPVCQRKRRRSGIDRARRRHIRKGDPEKKRPRAADAARQYRSPAHGARKAPA